MTRILNPLLITLNNIVLTFKLYSPFSQLSFYHVCSSGLPPCIAHDLFKGIVSYDLMLYIRYFILQNWFSEQYLNLRIKHFRFNKISSKTKALPIEHSS